MMAAVPSARSAAVTARLALTLSLRALSLAHSVWQEALRLGKGQADRVPRSLRLHPVPADATSIIDWLTGLPHGSDSAIARPRCRNRHARRGQASAVPSFLLAVDFTVTATLVCNTICSIVDAGSAQAASRRRIHRRQDRSVASARSYCPQRARMYRIIIRRRRRQAPRNWLAGSLARRRNVSVRSVSLRRRLSQQTANADQPVWGHCYTGGAEGHTTRSCLRASPMAMRTRFIDKATGHRAFAQMPGSIATIP